MKSSVLEDTLIAQIKAAKLPIPVAEYVFAKGRGRRWRFDFAFVDRKIAIEVEGGTWVNGRHNRGAGFEKDCEKYTIAAVDGWLVLRFTGKQIESGWALVTIEEMLARNTTTKGAK